jgi:hypothetical protein
VENTVAQTTNETVLNVQGSDYGGRHAPANVPIWAHGDDARCALKWLSIAISQAWHCVDLQSIGISVRGLQASKACVKISHLVTMMLLKVVNQSVGHNAQYL